MDTMMYSLLVTELRPSCVVPGSIGTDFSVIIVVTIVIRYPERVESKNILRDHIIATLSPSHVSPSSTNVGEHSPCKSTIPTVFVSKSIETEYLEKCVVVEDTDVFYTPRCTLVA
jgi:hypothetical protein